MADGCGGLWFLKRSPMAISTSPSCTKLPAVCYSSTSCTTSTIAASTSNDPNVWSGRALQEDFNELVVSGLASMYPAFGWRRFAPGHHGYQRVCDLRP